MSVKPGSHEGGMERRIEATAAFDKRHPDPSKNYGIHGVEFRFSLIRATDAVSFGISTGWLLPSTLDVAGDSSTVYRRALGERLPRLDPMPMGMHFHVAMPTADYMIREEPRDCDLLAGGKCYGDVTFTGADRPFFALVERGLDGLWEQLTVELDAFVGVPA